MDFLKNLKISQKVLSLVFLSSFFIFIVGLVGFYFTNKTSQDMNTIYQHKTLPISWLNECERLEEKMKQTF